MADLNKAVSKTVFPNGMVKVYDFGMLVKPRKTTDHEVNVWRRWLRFLAYKYHWRE